MLPIIAYQLSKDDVIQLQSIGYKILYTGANSFEDFMQKKFPNFNLHLLLRVVETNLASTTNANILRELIVDGTNGSLRIIYSNQLNDEDDALRFIRSFSNVKGHITATHNFCVIPKNSRNKGLIKPVFKESLQQYVNMGVEEIFVHAGLSSGGYVWAKHGFVAVSQKEMNLILKAAKQTLSEKYLSMVRRIYDLYYDKNPNGKAFPIELWAAFDFMKPVLMGSDWHGCLNLKDQEQSLNFMNYVFR